MIQMAESFSSSVTKISNQKNSDRLKERLGLSQSETDHDAGSAFMQDRSPAAAR